MTSVDYYELLGVPADADAATIKKAYRTLLKQVHPDTGGNTGMFRLVQEAYETLSDTHKRQMYDRSRDSSGASSGAAEPPAPTPAADSRPSRRDNGAAKATTTSWAQRLHSPAAKDERVTPPSQAPIRLAERLLCGASAATAAWFVMLCAAAGFTWPEMSLSVTLCVTGAGLVVPVRWFAYGPHLVAAGLALTYLAVSSLGADLGPVGWACVVLSVAGAVIRLVRHVVLDADLDERAPVEMVSKYVSFGSPGSGVPQASAGVDVAARVAAETTSELTHIPGVRIVHRVRASSSQDYGVDQVVVCGKKVALVVSSPAAPGTYSWSHATDSLLYNGAHVTGGNVLSVVDHAQFARVLKGCDVRTFVLLHSPAGPLTCAPHPGGDRVVAGSPQDVLEGIGQWFTTDHDPTVDRRIIAKLAERML